MSKDLLDLYAELIEIKRMEEAIYQESLAKREEVKTKNEHEWFIIEKRSYKCIYYCPICEERKRISKPIKKVKLDFNWIELYKAILERNIEKANKEIQRLRNMSIV